MSEINRSICLILIAISAMLLTSAQYFDSPEDGGENASISASEANWTFLLYMSSDVPASPLNWTADINELEVGLGSDDIQIFALVDPEGIGDSRVYRIIEDASGSPDIVSEIIPSPDFFPVGDEVNMGDPDTLIGFADLVIDSYYQGGRIGLIFWGHGGGWLGVCPDRSDILNASEIVYGLETISEHLSKRLDIVAFDACSMGSIEVLSELSASASLVVSSEISIPAYGFPYDSVMNRLSTNLTKDPIFVATAFADEYVKFGALITDTTSQATVIDLGLLTNAADTFIDLAEMYRLFIPIQKPNFENARNQSVDINETASIDLPNFLKYASQDAPQRVRSLSLDAASLLESAVLYNRIYISQQDSELFDQSSLSGISIYYPSTTAYIGNYAQATNLGNMWSGFLADMFSNITYPVPSVNLDMNLLDLRYGDRVNDSIEFEWEMTNEISIWEIDIADALTGEIMETMIVSDMVQQYLIDDLNLGAYNVYIYGRDVDNKYRYFAGFQQIEIGRVFNLLVTIPAEIDIWNTELVLENQRTSLYSNVSVSNRTMSILLAAPEPYRPGDNIVIELRRDGDVLALGMITLGDAVQGITLTGIPGIDFTTIFILILLTAALLALAAIRLTRKEAESEFGLGLMENIIGSSEEEAPSVPLSLEKDEPPLERSASALDADKADKRK